MILDFNKMDYTFYDYHCMEYDWQEEQKQLIITCSYMSKEITSIKFEMVKQVMDLCILPSHVIEYFIRTYDNEMDCFCFEIKFKMLVETTKVWAQKVKRA